MFHPAPCVPTSLPASLPVPVTFLTFPHGIEESSSRCVRPLPPSHLSSNLSITANSSSLVGTPLPPPLPPPPSAPPAGTTTAAAAPPVLAPFPEVPPLSNRILLFPPRKGKNDPKNDPWTDDVAADAAAADDNKATGSVSDSHVWNRATRPGVGHVAKTTVFFPHENLQSTEEWGGGGVALGLGLGMWARMGHSILATAP